MQIELKILDKKFYSTESNGMLLYPLPRYQTLGSAAIDLVCTKDITIYPGETKQIHTGIAIHIGSNTDDAMRNYREHWDYAGLILPRSGLGTRGLILANTIGLIDSDYQGELLIRGWNRDTTFTYNQPYGSVTAPNEYTAINDPILLKAGDRFAQLVIVPIARAKWKIVEEFTNTTDRSIEGFGSTNNET